MSKTRASVISFNDVQKDLDIFHEKLTKIMSKKGQSSKQSAVQTSKNTNTSDRLFTNDASSMCVRKPTLN